MCRQVPQHDATEICGQSNSHWFRRVWLVRFEDSGSTRLVELRRVNHGIEEAEQGTACDEVGSPNRLHLSDGLHQRPGGGAANAEEFFHVLTHAQTVLRGMVLDSVASPHSRRNYAKALDDLFAFSAGKVKESMSGWAVWSVVEQSVKEIGIERLGAHDLRRTCAKRCRKNGGNIEQIKFLLGHSLIQTTERYLGSEQDIESAVNDTLGL